MLIAGKPLADHVPSAVVDEDSIGRTHNAERSLFLDGGRRNRMVVSGAETTWPVLVLMLMFEAHFQIW